MARGRPRKKKAEPKDMKFMDGKAAPDAYANLKTIDEIIGDSRSSPFRAKSLAEFEKQLGEMNLADMQALAPKAGLIPIADRPLLRKRLIDEFRKENARRMGYGHVKAVTQGENLKSELGEKALSILKDGR